MLDTKQLEQRLEVEDPTFARAMRTYVAEAGFFHPLVSEPLRGGPSRTIVEVGAGVGLLAMRLAADGHHVTAFEPQSAGYDRNRAMRDLLESCWTAPDTSQPVHWQDTYFDPDLLDPARPVDLAVSVNVLEHVPDPADLVAQVTRALGPSGTYRFICPNYTIPYEPHFNMPTLFAKSLTERVLGARIRAADKTDPQGLWDELSWPTQRRLASDLAAAGVRVRFSRRATQAYLRRLQGDQAFLARKAPAAARVASTGARALTRVVDVLPLAVVPVIDGTARA